MKLEMIKGLAILKATTKKESEKLMMFYLGKSPATKEVTVEAPEKKKYTHTRGFKMKRVMKEVYSKKPKRSCEYGCGEFKNLPAHLLQKHGIGKDGQPKTPNFHRGKNAGTPTPARREYLSLPDLPSLRGS